MKKEERRLELLEKSLAADERKLKLELERERIKIDAEKRKDDQVQRDLDAARIKADIRSKSKDEDYQVLIKINYLLTIFNNLINPYIKKLKRTQTLRTQKNELRKTAPDFLSDESFDVAPFITISKVKIQILTGVDNLECPAEIAITPTIFHPITDILDYSKNVFLSLKNFTF